MKMKTETKRQAILEIAAQTFRELGFERTSMSEICARVGGSKATLYNYFASKDELFVATMLTSTEAEFAAAHLAIAPSANEDVAHSLRQFGESFLAFIYSPVIQVQRHLAIAESRRSELGRLLYERGVLRSHELITEFLQAAMALGKLRLADPQLAMQQLCALLEAELLERFLFQLLGEVSAEQIKAVTARAIAAFMAIYGPPADAGAAR